MTVTGEVGNGAAIQVTRGGGTISSGHKIQNDLYNQQLSLRPEWVNDSLLYI